MSALNLWGKAFEFAAGFQSGALPVHPFLGRVSPLFPLLCFLGEHDLGEVQGQVQIKGTVMGVDLRWRDQKQELLHLSGEAAMAGVNTQNRAEGLPEVEMGIGIHTGEVVVGNIGSDKRTKYGVVGSHVNLTNRIESYTVGGQVLISEDTWHEIGPSVQVTEKLEVDAKGVDKPITIYHARGIGGKYNLFLPESIVTLVSLPQAIPLQFTLLEGKHLGDTLFTGSLVKLSAKDGEVHSDHAVESWSNIKLQLMSNNGEELPGDLYAKVMGHAQRMRPGLWSISRLFPRRLRRFSSASWRPMPRNTCNLSPSPAIIQESSSSLC